MKSPTYSEPTTTRSRTHSPTGGSTAHRNGPRGAQAEASIRYPTTGEYQRAAVTHQRKATMNPPNSACGSHITPPDNPPIDSRADPPAAITSCATSDAASATSGITTMATANFDRTVSTSESGSDFQNSTERSRRSA